jgi:hypothetical protein
MWKCIPKDWASSLASNRMPTISSCSLETASYNASAFV